MKIVKVKKEEYKLDVKRCLTGNGIFAGEDIPKGSFIAQYGGIIIQGKENIEKLPNTKFLFEINRNKILNGNHKSNIARYINHSCKPNSEAVDYRGDIYIDSIRNIKKGEEITYNYGKEYFEDFIQPAGCKCIKCRK